jgi:hypothetical protein
VPDSPVTSTVLLVGATVSISLKNGLDQLEDLEHRLAAADDVREGVRRAQRPLEEDVLLLQLAALAADLALLERLAHDLDHLRRKLGAALLDVVGRAEPQRLDRRLLRRVGGDHHAEDVGVELLGAPEHLDTAHVRHPDVGHEQVHAALLERGQRLAPVLGLHDLVPLAAEPVRQQLADRGLVIDQEDSGCRGV